MMEKTVSQGKKIPEGQSRIMKTAIDEFASKGFASASTRDIAEKAGVSEALIFKYYKNKKNLFQKIVFPHIFSLLIPMGFHRVSGILKQEHSTFREFAISLMQERMEFALSHKKYLKILLQELFLNAEIQRKVKEKFSQSVWPEFEQKIQQYQQTDEILKMPAEQIFRIMLSLFMGMIVSAVIVNHPYANLQEECKITVDCLMRGIGTCNKGVSEYDL